MEQTNYLSLSLAHSLKYYQSLSYIYIYIYVCVCVCVCVCEWNNNREKFHEESKYNLQLDLCILLEKIYILILNFDQNQPDFWFFPNKVHYHNSV